MSGTSIIAQISMSLNRITVEKTRIRGYKTFFMLNSTEHEMYLVGTKGVIKRGSSIV